MTKLTIIGEYSAKKVYIVMLIASHQIFQLMHLGLGMENMKKYLAELLGTFVLVFIGTGSAVVAGKSTGLSDEQNVDNFYHIAVAQRVSENS